MLKIVTAPNSILSEVAKPVGKIDKSILNLIKEMEQVLLAAKDPEGVGLAAPQVGKSLQLFITKPTPKSPIQVFINPKIVSKTEAKTEISHLTIAHDRGKALNGFSAKKSTKKLSKTQLEGCLSLPNIWGTVNRNPSVTLSYLDPHGRKRSKIFKGLLAIIIKHEVDHLNGILFPRRVLEQDGQLYKSHKNEKGEDVFEEIEL